MNCKATLLKTVLKESAKLFGDSWKINLFMQNRSDEKQQLDLKNFILKKYVKFFIIY